MATSLNSTLSGAGADGSAREAFGRYALLEKIGQGGMAEVFRAKSYGVEGFEKVLVIKRILQSLARDPKFVEMFVREAKLSVRLSHANVVQVFDLGRVGDALFIAMEYVHGIDLATLLAWLRRQGRPMPVSVAAYVAAEVAKGLDHAHRRRDEQLRPLGIVHRDVSPQNVLLSYEGEVKVTDFGIAKARDTLDAEEDDAPRKDGRIAIRGKYAYLSPEQASGHAIDARADIWALGVVLYEMLAGTNPFAAPTMFETLRRVRSAEAPPLELARPDIPADFATIVRRALALDPNERYADAARLHDDLLAFLYTSGERFGAHALSEMLIEFREGTSHSSSANILAQGAEVGVEEGLVRTPVEVPDVADVATAPPRTGAIASHVTSQAEGGAGGLARAASLGEHREVTALVLEIGGALDAALADDKQHGDRPAMSAHAPIRKAAAEAESLLRRYGAQIVETDPGRITAIFGMENPDGRDTDIAVRCALLLSRLLREAAPTSGVGIHGGRVVVAANGELVRDERLTALLAGARDLARAREGRVAISTAALRHVQASIDTETVPDASRTLASVNGMLVKGRKPASETYAKFVGRREELRVLGEILAAATRRRARIVTIHGAPGVGKTRLLHEVQRRLQRGSYNVGWYLASCPPHGKDVPLSGVAAMLRVLCGIEEGDDEQKLAAVRPRLRALGLGDDELRIVLDLVKNGGDFASAEDGAGPQEHAAAALAHMISRLCDDRLHVLAWDDIQAIDSASSAVLSSVARAVSTCRVVLLFAGLEGDRLSITAVPSSTGGPAVQHHLLVLQELAREEVHKVVATRLAVKEVAPDLLTFITARAGGNPLYIEELLRAMQDAGAITRVTEPGDEKTGKPAYDRAIPRKLTETIDLPKSLRGLVASRLARLSVKERAVLTAVALLGEPAEIDLLAASAGEEIVAVERMIAPLEASGLLRRGGERSVAFVSPVARDVVLDAAPIEAKRELHAAIASALIASPNPALDRIAHHLLEGGDRDRAATYYARSGEGNLAAGRPEASSRDLTRAFTIADLRNRPRDEVQRWLHTLNVALGTSRGGRSQGTADCATAIDRAIARIDADGDKAARLAALIDAGYAFANISQFDRGKDCFTKAEQLAGNDERGLRRILRGRAKLASRSGEFGEAADLLGRIEPLIAADASADWSELYEVLVGMGGATAAVGGDDARDRGLAYLDRAEALAKEKNGDTPLLEVERAKTRCLIHFFARDWVSAAGGAERAAELSRSSGFLHETAVNLHNLGDARIRIGDNAAAYAALRQSLALAEEGGHDRLVAVNRAPIAYLDGVAGDDGAKQRLSDIIAWHHSRGHQWDELSARYWLGLLYLAKNEKEAALDELTVARALAVQLGMRSMMVDCDEGLARAR